MHHTLFAKNTHAALAKMPRIIYQTQSHYAVRIKQIVQRIRVQV